MEYHSAEQFTDDLVRLYRTKDLRLSKSVIFLYQRFTGPKTVVRVMLLRTTDLLDGSKYEAKSIIWCFRTR